MTITRLFCAGATLLLLAGGANAQSGSAPGMHAHPYGKAVTTRPVKKPRVSAQAKDPSNAYWNDPSRQGFPSWSRDGR